MFFAVAHMIEPMIPRTPPLIINHRRLHARLARGFVQIAHGELGLPEDIAESPNHDETNATAQCLNDRNKGVVGVWSKIRIDDCDGICR